MSTLRAAFVLAVLITGCSFDASGSGTAPVVDGGASVSDAPTISAPDAGATDAAPGHGHDGDGKGPGGH
jgi:hypothetical protein